MERKTRSGKVSLPPATQSPEVKEVKEVKVPGKVRIDEKLTNRGLLKIEYFREVERKKLSLKIQ
jgi:hypothetical protein